MLAHDEWNQLGFIRRMSTNKEEFIKTKSEEYFQNHFKDMENEKKRENSDEKEEEERKIRKEEESKIREEEERKIREDFFSSSNQLQVSFQITSFFFFQIRPLYYFSSKIVNLPS